MRNTRGMLAAVVATALTLAPLYGTSAGVLSPITGTVEVNGHTAIAGRALLPGESVQIGSSGSARLVFAGTTVLAAAKTRFQLADASGSEQLKLAFGMVKVDGALPVALNTHTVAPMGKSAEYSVATMGSTSYVEATKGDVAVRFANRTYVVHAGEGVRFDDPATPAAAAAGGGSVPIPLAIGIIAAATIVSGVIVHQATQCSNCVASPTGNIQ